MRTARIPIYGLTPAMGTGSRAEEYDDIINYSPFLLRGEQLVLIEICRVFLDMRPDFSLHM
jgi:hypothetical protein